MPATPKNKLTLQLLTGPNGEQNGARLFGFLGKKKIRYRSKDVAALEQLKQKLEEDHELERLAIEVARKFQHTWLTVEQIRDAEAAITRMPAGRTLVESAEAADLVLGSGEVVPCATAKERYMQDMDRRRLEYSTIKGAKSILTLFLKSLPAAAKHVHEIQDNMSRDFCHHKALSDYTRVARATALRKWFNFCVREKMIKRVPIAFSIEELVKRAKPKKEPEILTPEEAERLIDSACAWGSAACVVFTILSTWCFMRKSEAMRFSPDMLRKMKNDPRTWVHLKGKKLGSRWRDVPIPAQLFPLFQSALNEDVFVEKKKKDGTTSKRLAFTAEDFNHVRAGAGLIKLIPGSRPGRFRINRLKWSGNILRHTGMTYLYQETGDVDLVTTRAGNSKEVAFLHYLRDAPVDAYERFNAVVPKPGAWKPKPAAEAQVA